MYSLVASCLLASLAATTTTTTGPRQHAAVVEAFTPRKQPSAVATATGRRRRIEGGGGSNAGGASSSLTRRRSEESSPVNKPLGVSAAPLELDASSSIVDNRPQQQQLPRSSSSQLLSSSSSSSSPLTDQDIELQLHNHILQLRTTTGEGGNTAATTKTAAAVAAATATASSSSSSTQTNKTQKLKRRRRPRILRTGADGVGTIRVVDAPGPGRPAVHSKARGSKGSNANDAKAKAKAKTLRLTREEEVHISAAIRALRSAVRVRDDLAVALARDPTEYEWAAAVAVAAASFGGGGGGRSSSGSSNTNTASSLPSSSSASSSSSSVVGAVLNLRRIMTAGREARTRLVAANIGLVANMASKYATAIRSSTQAGGSGGVGSILTHQDLIQEGNLGLMEAAERFEPSKGFRFSTYGSHWVRQRMLRSIADYSRVIRLPAHVHSKLSTIRKARALLSKDLGRPPTDDELSRHLSLPLDKLLLYSTSDRHVLSLEAPTNSRRASTNLDDRRRVLGDVIADSAAPTPTEDALSQNLRSEVRKAVYDDGCLTVRERDVVVLRFGLEDGTERTVKETATKVGVSVDRVRAVEARALNKLRSNGRTCERLREYVVVGGNGHEEEGGGQGGGRQRQRQQNRWDDIDIEDDPDRDRGASSSSSPIRGGAAAAAVDYVVGSSPENLWSF